MSSSHDSPHEPTRNDSPHSPDHSSSFDIPGHSTNFDIPGHSTNDSPDSQHHKSDSPHTPHNDSTEPNSNIPARRDKVISVRFSEDEYRGLRERASSKHVSLSDYIRERMDFKPIYWNINPFSTTSTFAASSSSYNITFTNTKF